MRQTFVLSIVALVTFGIPQAAGADEDDIARYRTLWNPFSAGPELVSSADLQPQGQLFVRPYLYSEFAYGQFGAWAFSSGSLSRKLVALAPQIELSYGLLDWLEFEMYVPENSWWEGACLRPAPRPPRQVLLIMAIFGSGRSSNGLTKLPV